eukprot:TRINITY_DN3587_c0_g1_i3.p2 TRINITY_DN3587_c0_g1~~TRINITY_DN3587_c0_g1_i3.p2  ORF type:complete len:123 (-),score=4.56 TRINITY_DN3587_c0_g1_i3:309-677(-)
MKAQIFIICTLLLGIADSCYDSISQCHSYYGSIEVYDSPNFNSLVVGQISQSSGNGVICYVYGQYYNGSYVWGKTCLDDACCQVGYVPLYHISCSGGILHCDSLEHFKGKQKHPNPKMKMTF